MGKLKSEATAKQGHDLRALIFQFFRNTIGPDEIEQVHHFSEEFVHGMKTEDDLLEAFTRYCFESTGAPAAQVDLLLHQYRAQLTPRLKKTPAKPLTDEEFESRFEQMKKEAPAYLSFLLTGKFPELPSSGQ